MIFGTSSSFVHKTSALRFLFISNWDGEANPSTGVFLYSKSANPRLFPAISVLISISLAICTDFSANLF